MAYPGADAASWRNRVRDPLVSAWRRVAAALEGYPLERIGLAALAAGVVLRVAAMFTMDFRSDGDTYTAMGHAWALRHEFLMPYGDVTTWAPTDPGYSRHYPPAYPFYLGVWFSIFGFGLWQAKIAALVMSLLALGAVYFTTRNLYGATAAAIVGGLIGLEPQLIWVTGTGFSENMVMLFFALTMWAILKSLKDERFIVIAGVAAGLAYLSRASVGYFFVIAGIGGFFWRFYFMRWRVFTNRWYMLAILLFGGIVLSWALRNVLLFGYETEIVSVAYVVQMAGIAVMALAGLALLAVGALAMIRKRAPSLLALAIPALVACVGVAAFVLPYLTKLPIVAADFPRWETSSYVSYVQELAWQNPDQWGHALWMKFPFFLAMLAWYVVPFLPEVIRGTRKVREEHTSALWLSVFLVWVLAWIITSMFWVFEKSWMYWLDNHRYVLIGLLPLAWMIVREMRTERASARIRTALLMLSLFAACAGTFAAPVKFSDLRAAEFMDPYLAKNDTVAIDGGTIKYAFYAYLSNPQDINVWGCDDGGTECIAGRSPEFILTLKEHQRYGDDYTLSYQHNQTYWNCGTMRAKLWVRDDVLDARGMPTAVYDHDYGALTGECRRIYG